jgi:hypothetical protein
MYTAGIHSVIELMWQLLPGTHRSNLPPDTLTRNSASWLLVKSHNAFWHFKKYHNVKFMSWLLKKMTTTCSGIMKIPQCVMVVSFYGHDET